MKIEICSLCGKQQLPECLNTTVRYGSAAYSSCPNYVEHRRELWDKKKKSKMAKPLEWEDRFGIASKGKNHQALVFSIGPVSVIVRLPNGKLAEWKKDDIRILLLDEKKKDKVIYDEEDKDYEERRIAADHHRRVQRQRRGMDVG